MVHEASPASNVHSPSDFNLRPARGGDRENAFPNMKPSMTVEDLKAAPGRRIEIGQRMIEQKLDTT